MGSGQRPSHLFTAADGTGYGSVHAGAHACAPHGLAEAAAHKPGSYSEG